MNKITFGIIEEVYTIDTERRISYGIAAYSDGDTMQIVATVNDVTSNRTRICELVELCNREKLSPCQIRDVVEDFLGEE